jgi:uncharacterized protein YjiS (DUF1127 family)
MVTIALRAFTRERKPRPLFGLLRGWIDRTEQRRYLAELDDRLLSDAGLTRADRDNECSKPFWRR